MKPELTSLNLGKKCIITFDYYDGKGYSKRNQDAVIYSLLVSINHGAYGYAVRYYKGKSQITSNFIDHDLHFVKSEQLLGNDISNITIL